jgi:hydroxymethylpyrimidine/phosphomethylpyrimidine kinase
MPATRPYVVSIAGFDPSAGAGVLADCKTFEQHGVYGFGVCSALTVQNDSEFLHVQWLSAAQVIEQLQPLTKKFTIAACKIGIIGSLDILQAVIHFLNQHNRHMHIVWDPVLKASAGYGFHNSIAAEQLSAILRTIDLITPNYEEWQRLSDHAIPCAVLLKGGHRPHALGVDTLYEGNESTVIEPGVEQVSPKHGSGCVLSAAITARLAKGDTVRDACRHAKQYIETFLNSNETLLGYHT